MKERSLNLLRKIYQSLPADCRRIPYIVLISSFGRSGSTLLWEATYRSLFPWNKRIGTITRAGHWDLAEPLGPHLIGCVLKTHFRSRDIDITVRDDQIRNIYVISKPSESVKSLIYEASLQDSGWKHRHLNHLGVNDTIRPESLIESDVLDLKGRLGDWRECNIRTLCIKYECLWDYVAILSEHSGLNISLPEKRNRSEKPFDQKVMTKIEETYREADQLYDSMSPYTHY